LGCGASVLFSRSEFEKKVKKIIPGELEIED
jgi:hypothetical protein